jgi:ribosome-binding factor A
MNNPHRHDRIEELIRELAATFIETISNRDALVSVTRVIVSQDEKSATILLSVLPDTKREQVLDFIKRNLGELRTYLMEHMRTHSIPYLDAMIDGGEINRQKIDELLLGDKDR